MREIKFRAWHKEWRNYYSVLSINFDTKSIVINAGHNFHHILYFNEVILEQYTGLKDKNGVEIYEGDIVSVKVDDNMYMNDLVIFDNDLSVFRISLETKILFSLGVIHKEYIEVIGNIHENKELLGEIK